MAYEYWAELRFGKSRAKPIKFGPFATREAAIGAAQLETVKHYGKGYTITHGYGAGGAYFDIRWLDGKHQA